LQPADDIEPREGVLRELISAITLAFVFAVHVPAGQAQNSSGGSRRAEVVKVMGDWYIADTNGPRGCYLGRLQNERTVLRLNWQPSEQIYFLSAHHPALNDLAEMQMPDFTLRFTPGATLERPAIVMRMDGDRNKSLLFVESDAPILRQLAESRRISINLDGKTLMEVDTLNAGSAMAELAKCNQAKLGISPTTLGFAAAPGTSAPPGPPEKWKSLDGWWVGYDASRRGCFIKTRFDDLQLGSDAAGGFYILIENRNWKWIEKDRQFEVVLRLNPYPERRVTMRGVSGTARQLPGLLLPEKDRAYIDNFAGSNELTIERNGDLVGRVSLSHTGAALREMDECQKFYSAKKG
jgi:hypothetical protein